MDLNTARSYGDNFTIVPARRFVSQAEAEAAIERARAEVGHGPYEYDVYTDAIVARRRLGCRFEDGPDVEPIGAILFAPARLCSDVIEIYALEIAEGYERGDVERHIERLFDLQYPNTGRED